MSNENPDIEPDANNLWRRETPGHDGWAHTARSGDANKYLMISADSHCKEPANLWAERLPEKYRDRVPRIEIDEKGDRYLVMEGWRKSKLRDSVVLGEDKLRAHTPGDAESRRADLVRDGVDGEIIFPNKGLTMWATEDADFSTAQCRVYNDWVWDELANKHPGSLPMAALNPGDINNALAELDRVVATGFRGITLPCRPVWGAPAADKPAYNKPEYDRFWDALEESGLPLTFHIGTGGDPRAATGRGGAIINYVAHALAPGIELVTTLCSSGILAQRPAIRFALIEAGIGWVAWSLAAMDEAYKKHHMWVRPKLDGLPSDYFRRQGFVTFQEDDPGIATAEQFDLIGNFLWANDYPHQEGNWPHSAAAIERSMGSLSDNSRARILGLNCAELFGIEVPANS